MPRAPDFSCFRSSILQVTSTTTFGFYVPSGVIRWTPSAHSAPSVAKSGWSAPIVCEVLFPDRAKGGVRVVDGRLVIDLAYGTELRNARKAAGDFRMGALALIETKNCRLQTG